MSSELEVLIENLCSVGAFVTWRALCAPRACGALRKRRSVRERIARRRP